MNEDLEGMQSELNELEERKQALEEKIEIKSGAAMKRSVWDSLSHAERMAHVKKGGRLIDDRR